ncbi:MAG: glycoside hydrolase family 97 catalytic domain-containing protein [Rikenellaceae bacterium]
MKKNFHLLSLVALACVTVICSCSTPEVGQYKLSSPNKSLNVTLENRSGVMTYTLAKGGTQIVKRSEVSIFGDATVLVKEIERSSVSSSWSPVWGQFSEIEDCHNELKFTLDVEGREVALEVRLFDEGVGFRYRVDDYNSLEGAVLFMEYNTYDDDLFYWAGYHQDDDLGPYSISDVSTREVNFKYAMPVVVESKSENYLALLESDLFMTEGFDSIKLQFNKDKGSFFSINPAKKRSQEWDLVTPWRVILVGDEAGDLSTNTTSLNLATECQIEDTSWIKPGIALWDWRVHGHVDSDGFRYGIDTESYFRFIDCIAKWGLDYFLIDDAWYDKVELGRIYPSTKLDVDAVIEYAREKGVDLMLYYDRRRGYYGDDELFAYYRELDMKGIKYGFRGPNVPFTQHAVREGAKEQLMVNLHDGPVPMTGLERTFPNAISREYCHGQQDFRRAFTPEMFIKMALVNAIHGPLDMSNGNFDLVEINSGTREKGPLKTNSYFSTVVSEVARIIIINTGLAAIPDAPDVYAEKSDLFELIARTPVGEWDESVVVNSKFSQYITTARRKGSQWFVGTVVGRECDGVEIATDFLERGKEYAVTYYMDADETDCQTNPEAYRVVEGRIKGGDIIDARCAKGGGHAMWIR